MGGLVRALPRRVPCQAAESAAPRLTGELVKQAEASASVLPTRPTMPRVPAEHTLDPRPHQGNEQAPRLRPNSLQKFSGNGTVMAIVEYLRPTPRPTGPNSRAPSAHATLR